jgi:hypothetical protein
VSNAFERRMEVPSIRHQSKKKKRRRRRRR